MIINYLQTFAIYQGIPLIHTRLGGNGDHFIIHDLIRVIKYNKIPIIINHYLKLFTNYRLVHTPPPHSISSCLRKSNFDLLSTDLNFIITRLIIIMVIIIIR